MLQYIIAFLGICTFVFLLYKNPKVETYVLFIAAALPFIDAKILPLEYGFIKVYDVVSIISIIIFFKEFISFKASSRGKIYLVLVVLFWIFLLLSKLNSRHPTNNLYFLYQPFTIFIYSRFLIIYLEEKKEALYKFVKAFQLSVLLLAGVIFIQLVVGPNFTFLADLNPNVLNEDTGLIRYPSFFQDSQTCGLFLAIGSFSLLYFDANISFKKKRFQYISFLFVVVAVFLAGSRSAIGGWAVGMVIFFLVQNARIKTIIISFGVLAGILFLILSPKEGVFSRTESLSEDYLFRRSIWEETGEIIAEYPVLGIGFGNFQKYIKRNKQDLYLQTEDGGDFIYFNQPENGYLKILVEQGYSGFIIFILLVILPILGCLKNALNGKGKKEIIVPIAAFIAWAVAFNSVYSLLDYRILIAVATYVSLTLVNSQNTNMLLRKNGISNELILNK